MQQPATLRIEGRLDGPAAGTLAIPADWVVELRDDDAGQVLAEQRGKLTPTQPPISFSLSVDTARIDPAHRHSVRGALSVQGQVRWLSAPRPVDVQRPGSIAVGSLPLQPYVSPGGFASTFDCGGRRVTIGYGSLLRLVDGAQVHDLAAVPGRPSRFERPGDPATFVQLGDASATVSLQGRLLPRCVALP